jgi:hypothetical protein
MIFNLSIFFSAEFPVSSGYFLAEPSSMKEGKNGDGLIFHIFTRIQSLLTVLYFY